MAIIAGSSSGQLTRAMAQRLGREPTETRTDTFPDGETDVAVGTGILDADVYVVGSLAPPVNDRLVELLLLLDACRRSGASRITAVVPYLGYARKDRRTRRGEAVSLRVVADAIAAAGADRAVLVDPHVPQVDSIFSIPLEVVSAVPSLAAAIGPAVPDDAIVVAPDLGAVHLAERYAAELGLGSVAIVRKTRRSGTEVEASGLVGPAAERPVLLVDDIVSTGGTIEAAAKLVMEEWSPTSVSVAATHALLVADAADRLEGLGLATMVVSDSVVPKTVPSACSVVPIDDVLATTIARLHDPTADEENSDGEA
ncbi:MAG: ribose-phosphate diphosphokinase [Candidatus Limnocylindrales bacterium]